MTRAMSRSGKRAGNRQGNRPDPAMAGRRHGGRYWITGLHPVASALANPERDCIRLLLARDAGEDILSAAGARALDVAKTDRAEIERLAGAEGNHQGVALEVLPLDPVAIGDIGDPASGRPLLVLDQITDPRNVGAILRSAAVFGAAGVVLQDRNAPPESAALAKAASGALETVPMIRVGNLVQAMKTLTERGYWSVGLAGEAREDLSALPSDQPIALVLGAEGDGMRRLTREACDQVLRIPMAPNGVGSLNVSNAAAVALYEATRRR
jgi:23S rRNA (guanosine2251-2'-O)-methyltransferase